MGQCKRKHQRLLIVRKALLQQADGEQHIGMTKNLSFGGAYVSLARSKDVLELGITCKLVVFLEDPPGEIQMEFKSAIMRIEEDGVALQHIYVAVDGYQHFEQLMINASPDPEKLMAELEEHRGLEVQPDM